MHEMNDIAPAGAAELVVEWAPFRLAPGAEEPALLEASEALQRRFLDRREGFLRRDLLRGAGGQWADLVFWGDAASAKAASRAVGESAECLRYFSLMVPDDPDHPDGGMLHLRRVQGFTAGHFAAAGS